MEVGPSGPTEAPVSCAHVTRARTLARAAGIAAGDWNGKVVRTFCQQRFGVRRCRSSCVHSLRRLGFVVRRPKKRLVKADDAKRAAFVRDYAALRVVARLTGAKMYFV